MINLSKNNLYQNGYIELYDGNYILRRDLITYDGLDFKLHKVTSFDRLDLIAYKYYSHFVKDSSKYWWVIADINKIEDPMDLSDLVGTNIKIPDIMLVGLL